MKRLLFGTVLAAALLLLTASAAAAALGKATARREARSAVFEFGTRHHLDETNVSRCRRISSRSISCVATAKGEGSRRTKDCELTIVVRAVEHRFYTESVAAITHHRCTTEAKERLTSAAATSAIRAKADAFAGAPTELSYLYRVDEVTFTATARWERPATHPTEFLPTERCSVELKAELADGQVSVETEGFACY